MENAKVVLSAKLTTYGMPIYKNSAELEVSKIYLHSMWKKLKKKIGSSSKCNVVKKETRNSRIYAAWFSEESKEYKAWRVGP